MILGLFLRSFKAYRSLYFIPVATSSENLFSMYVGENGVGKSAILEAFDTFFNQGKWNVHKQGKKEECFVAPVLMIPKALFDAKISNAKTKEIVGVISNYFWNSSESTTSNLTTEEFKAFFALKERLKAKYRQDNYLIILGSAYNEPNKAHFITFNAHLRAHISTLSTTAVTDQDLAEMVKCVKGLYSYVYLPVETKIEDILRLESRHMKELMNQDVLSKIDDVLSKKVVDHPSKPNGSKISAVGYINISLNNFIEEINTVIQAIDPAYSYQSEAGLKKNLTPADIRDKVLQSYFTLRGLKKEHKELSELSSGERRIAMIDIAYACLVQDGEKDKIVILAIDEPESSLHIRKCYAQFNRLENLAVEHGIQIITTTHWYGGIPTLESGYLHYIEGGNKPKVSSYSFNEVYEERGSLPDDILLKSYYELASSIISLGRLERRNIIICEGNDDKTYLNKHLAADKKYLIIPVGGCGNVIKLYKYLYVPLNEKVESKLLNSKILCLVDSDVEQLSIDINSQSKDKKLKIARVQINSRNEAQLCDLSGNGTYEPTCIEDCLNSKTFFDALCESVDELATPEAKNVLGKFEYNTSASNSRLKGEYSILKPKELVPVSEKELIYDFVNNRYFKYAISEKYVSKEVGADVPPIFLEIGKFFD